MRGVKEQPSVSAAVDAAELKWPRADEAWQAVQWALARDPDVGPAINSSGTLRGFVFDGAKSIGLPTVEVIYRVESDHILIEDVEFRDSNMLKLEEHDHK
ncbi:hypothetical protein NFO65_25405 [Neorhizobium galegae]|uniref:hypothetical protein n=1 Tax=Neorhizobium galegae TaxID=399 RepID=UPI002100F0E0|nr:hypothetical protein [Neorhizobium galegae]MCQ1574073.1 hypothetical protein [Neorhizobium galegae]